MSIKLVKLADEGTNSPFIARMFAGILDLRHLIVITNNNPLNIQITKRQFDRLYEPIRSNLSIALEAARSLNTISNQLIEDGLQGKLVETFSDGNFGFVNTRGPLIQKEFDSLVEHSVVAIRTHLNRFLTDIFDIDIGKLFDKKSRFEAYLQELNLQNSGDLSAYLKDIRSWSDPLIDGIWNQTKHANYRLSEPLLELMAFPNVTVTLPQVCNTPVNRYGFKTINRCCIFVEDMIVYGFQYLRHSPIRIIEIPLVDRPRYENKRFRADIKSPTNQLWSLSFKDDMEIK